jgi:hypothetical protein
VNQINQEQETGEVFKTFCVHFGFILQQQNLDYSKYLELWNRMIKTPAWYQFSLFEHNT